MPCRLAAGHRPLKPRTEVRILPGQLYRMGQISTGLGVWRFGETWRSVSPENAAQPGVLDILRDMLAACRSPPRNDRL